MRPRGVALTLAVILAALLGWWVHARFYWVRETTWAGYQGEALDNDFLAAQRLLQATGHPAASVPGLPAQLPPPGDVLILPRRSQAMAPADVARIANWVAAGGLLLAAGAEDRSGADRDGLFGRFGARLVPADQHDPGPAAFGPGLKVELDPRSRIQASGAESAIVERALGQGAALLCVDLECLRNDRIQAFDHADFLCAVADRRPGASVWIVTREVAGDAWSWLRQHAWPFLAALAAFCLAALWAAAPRFGPWLPDPDPARRSFLEHLDACGRYQWRAAQGRPLLGASREAFLKRLAQVHPGWAVLGPGPLCQLLAQRTGLPPERIQRALHHPGPFHAAGFLEAIQTLQFLGRQL